MSGVEYTTRARNSPALKAHAAGRRTTNRPPSARASASTSPPAERASRRDSDRPSPAPPWFALPACSPRKPGSKIVASWPTGTPGPSSSTATSSHGPLRTMCTVARLRAWRLAFSTSGARMRSTSFGSAVARIAPAPLLGMSSNATPRSSASGRAASSEARAAVSTSAVSPPTTPASARAEAISTSITSRISPAARRIASASSCCSDPRSREDESSCACVRLAFSVLPGPEIAGGRGQLGLRRDLRERRAQLVRKLRGEALLTAHAGGEPVEQGVERGRQPRELVARRAQVEAAVEVLLAPLRRALGHARHPPGRGVDQQARPPPQHQDQEDREHERGDQRRPARALVGRARRRDHEGPHPLPLVEAGLGEEPPRRRPHVLIAPRPGRDPVRRAVHPPVRRPRSG